MQPHTTDKISDSSDAIQVKASINVSKRAVTDMNPSMPSSVYRTLAI
jgi:hypothetical protein